MNISMFISSAGFLIKISAFQKVKILFNLLGVLKFKANIKFTFAQLRTYRTNLKYSPADTAML